MNLREYLLDEIAEDAELGYLSPEEASRRMAMFEGGLPVGSAPTDDPVPAAARPGDGSATRPDAAAVVTADDPLIDTSESALSGERAVGYYLVRPRGGDAPGVLLIHENRGLTPYIKDVARRLGRLGYVVLAPDLLWGSGGTEAFSDSAGVTAALGAREPDDMLADLRAAFAALGEIDGVRAARRGALGFCFGGGMAWRLATKEPELAAVVAFYGPNPPLDDVPNIAAPVLGIYGEHDARVNSGIDAIKDAMSRAGKVFDCALFEGAQHAFHNDTNPDRYNATAAALAWDRATSWLDRYLNAS